MDFGPRNEDPCEKKVCLGADELFKKGKKLIKQREEAGASSHPSSSQDNVIPDGNGRGCPVDKDELGNSSWKLLHTMSVYYPEKPTEEEKQTAKQYMDSFSRMYPCDVCAEDLRKDLEKFPVRVEGREAFAGWMCMMHNRVNEKMGKPLFDCSKIFERWRDGWKDGSCD